MLTPIKIGCHLFHYAHRVKHLPVHFDQSKMLKISIILSLVQLTSNRRSAFLRCLCASGTKFFFLSSEATGVNDIFLLGEESYALFARNDAAASAAIPPDVNWIFFRLRVTTVFLRSATEELGAVSFSLLLSFLATAAATTADIPPLKTELAVLLTLRLLDRCTFAGPPCGC